VRSTIDWGLYTEGKQSSNRKVRVRVGLDKVKYIKEGWLRYNAVLLVC